MFNSNNECGAGAVVPWVEYIEGPVWEGEKGGCRAPVCVQMVHSPLTFRKPTRF